MFPALKTLLIPLAALALILGSAVALQTPNARADLSGTDDAADGVWFLDSYGTGTECDTAPDPREVRLFGVGEVTKIERVSGSDDPLPVIQIEEDDDLIMCVEPANDDDNVVFDTTGGGEWNEARCDDLSDDCVDEEGVGDDAITIPGDTNDYLIAITFSCNGPSVQTIDITQDDADDEISFRIMCKGEADADSIQITAIPDTVESAPALYNTSHALIRAIVTDAAGNPIFPDTDADVTSTCGVSALSGTPEQMLEQRHEALFNEGTGVTPEGINLGAIDAEFGIPPLPNFLDIITFSNSFETSTTVETIPLEVDTNAFPDDEDGGAGDGVPNHTEVIVIFHAEGCDPGPHSVTIEVGDAEATVDLTVIGPPAFMTITASPTELVCGEKSEIIVSVTDALNQPVSDNTLVEVITNHGGVLAGTGTSLTTVQPVNPLSSTTVEIFDGSGTAYLITSPEHYGPYEVLGASTPSQFGTGVQDSVPVTDQVTVTCTLFQAPPVTAPDTGTGQIRPPNTGDAGLATHAASTTLAVIAGAVAVTLAGLARYALARR